MPGEARELVDALVLEDGRRWGDAAVTEQVEDVDAVLDTTGPPYHGLTRARGWSKTTDLGAIAIAVMLAQLPSGSRLYGLASDKDQGRLLADAIAGFAHRTPALSGALTCDAYKITSAAGSVLEILPADVAGAWGLRPAFLIVDELAQWASTAGPNKLWEATTSPLTKVAGARLVVLTSAGDPAHWSAKILEHARTYPMWRVHEIPGPPPWTDRARLDEQRRRLPESAYRRLFLNEWTASEDRLTSINDLRACVTLPGPLDPQPGTRYVLGLDLGLKHDRTVAAVCHGDRLGADSSSTDVRVVLDRMQVWAGSPSRPVDLGAVEDWVTEAAHRYRAKLVVDPWQAIALCQRLRSKGIGVVEYPFSQQSVARLAVTLHTAIRDHRLALPPDEALIDELANVRLREMSPGVLRMDHDPDKHDDRAIALALAAQHLVAVPPSPFVAHMEQLIRQQAAQAARQDEEPEYVVDFWSGERMANPSYHGPRTHWQSVPSTILVDRSEPRVAGGPLTGQPP